MEKSLSLEAFNHLDHLYNGLYPDVELGKDFDRNLFVWVCNYGGMKFYRPLTMAESLDSALRELAKQN